MERKSDLYMNKVTKRLLTFFIGIPLILLLVIVKFQNHLLLNVTVVAASLLTTRELYNLFSTKTKLFPKTVFMAFNFLITALSYTLYATGYPHDISHWILLLCSFCFLGTEALTQKDFTKSIEKLSLSLFILFYSGYLFTFVTKLCVLEHSEYFISLFFILVFMCDSAAWFFGILFGKSTRGFIKASPNKSIVGFIGGIISSTLCGIIALYIFPDVFTFSITQMIILGAFTSTMGIIGDLIESVFKRSSNIKDSGSIIPGRGGILDSVDSLLFAIPVYYLLIFFLLG